MLDTQLARANALLAAITVEYAQLAADRDGCRAQYVMLSDEYDMAVASRDNWRACYAAMSDVYDMAIAALATVDEELTEETAAKEAWESFALSQEVLFECLNEEDWVGAQNAVEAIGSSRQTLRDLGEYDE
jgi:hypothetical protein